MTPDYRIIIYNRSTDRVGGTVDVPRPLQHQVLAIAGIATSAGEMGEYPLTEDQVRDISSLLRFAANFSRFHYHLEPVDPTRLRA